MKKYYDDYNQLNMEISNDKDGFMHIKLHQPKGIREITVTEAEGNEIIKLNRMEHNINKRENRHHVSLETYDPYGALIKDDTDPYQIAANKEEIKKLYKGIRQLNPSQQKLVIEKFWEGMKQIDIAKSEGVTKKAITNQFHAIFSQLKKNLQD